MCPSAICQPCHNEGRLDNNARLAPPVASQGKLPPPAPTVTTRPATRTSAGPWPPRWPSPFLEGHDLHFHCPDPRQVHAQLLEANSTSAISDGSPRGHGRTCPSHVIRQPFEFRKTALVSTIRTRRAISPLSARRASSARSRSVLLRGWRSAHRP